MNESSFFRLHDRLRHAIIHTLGWRELRPVQELALDAILDGNNAIVLAPTAGEERNGTPPPPRHEPFRRYTYGTPDERPPGRPYQVTYPAGDPALARQQRAAVGRARPGTA